MADQWLCGWRVVSHLDVPELPLWVDDPGEPDLIIRIGRLRDQPRSYTETKSTLEVGSDGTCLLAVGNVGSYLIDATGREVTVDPMPGADPRNVRAVLLGSVFGILCHRRGLLPLHASCVEIDGVAVAFTGPSGIGKSTLAAAFAAAGHRVISDDVTVIDLATPHGPLVRATFPRLKLRGDSLTHVQLGQEVDPAGPFEMQKYHMSLDRAFSRRPARLAALYHLVRPSTSTVVSAGAVTGMEMLRTLTDAVFRRTHGQAVLGAGPLFSSVARLGALVPSQAIAWPTGFSNLEADVGRLCARHAGGTTGEA